MKKLSYILPVMLCALLASCSKETAPVATEQLGIDQQFSPPADADPRVKQMYQTYNVWVRMDFNNWKEVTNAIIANDPINRWGVGKIDPSYRESAYTWMQTLLPNVSEKYVRTFFPLEFFFVKTYGGSFWTSDIKTIGRSRIIICWPNQMLNTQPITDPANHYYIDTVLTRTVWGFLGGMITARMAEPIKAFVVAGKAYDNGQAFDKISKEYQADGNLEKRDAALAELARSGGYVRGSASRNFDGDFSEWLKLIATESYENIKRDYLDNSPARAQKYEILIKYFKEYGWDIQAAGNKYRQKIDELN
ncbi:hypothetical protein HHL16_19125 [Pseudoflavitalea sp. G-6-1-2]|uniref:hypothetical protein n=1 Tax=Pseudoflavitalea sp. G-6-1-2 TaxID=2728841 RepID=UPI001469ED54|nr:hypothetical protein [Pseudoflavitalea sp. G-6-1-2]NML22998.1 hypothetical protein [Pseudoflavitalea sp. G-6-1-2]